MLEIVSRLPVGSQLHGEPSMDKNYGMNIIVSPGFFRDCIRCQLGTEGIRNTAILLPTSYCPS